ncbi:hypothetical protein BJ684DRAFT_15307 [Piptocephalis cylindrospora]|uniref:Uncharacterized protein n=1 Tax=Piptocephalis cylindrospora TaxID=1907219 RepID=A0A4P9Y5Q2_9FUNG|nr:hypothetical protein BJ684DRAFT_15307 [Piptocephalis cylindrospora]|eukprot:RKP14356.1 hypothetical protein BJ684DRAFT_15307 [Piptocephalis cylindrospora]
MSPGLLGPIPAAEQVLAKIKTIQTPEVDAAVKELRSMSDLVLRPALLACRARLPRLALPAMNYLQQLIQRRIVQTSSVPSLLSALVHVLDISTQDCQLRVLQTIPILLNHYPDVRGDALCQALVLCFRLRTSPLAVVHSIASATLRQVVNVPFDRLEGDFSQEARNDGLSEEEERQVRLQDACFIFRDICMLTNGESPSLLSLDSLSPSIGMELIESILQGHRPLFHSQPALTKMLREHMTSIVIRHATQSDYSINSPSNSSSSSGGSYNSSISPGGLDKDFPRTVRVIRLIRVVARYYLDVMPTECEIFLSLMLKQLEECLSTSSSSDGSHDRGYAGQGGGGGGGGGTGSESYRPPTYRGILALEFWHSLCPSYPLLCAIYGQFERQHGTGGIFYDLVALLHRLSSQAPLALSTQAVKDGGKETGSSKGVSGGTLAMSARLKVPCLDQMERDEPCSLPPFYAQYLTLTSLTSIVHSMSQAVLPHFDDRTTPAISSAQVHDVLSQLTKEEEKGMDSGTIEEGSLTLEQRKELQSAGWMTEVAWPALLAAFSVFLALSMDGPVFQRLLEAVRRMTLMSGVLCLSTPRDAFLTALGKRVIPSVLPSSNTGANSSSSSSTSSHSIHSSASSMYEGAVGGSGSILSSTQEDTSGAPVPVLVYGERSGQCLLELVRLTHTLAELLDDGAWHVVLLVLEQADGILSGRPLPKGKSLASVGALGGGVGGSVVGSSHSDSLPGGVLGAGQGGEGIYGMMIMNEMNALFTDQGVWPKPALSAFFSACTRLAGEWWGVRIRLEGNGGEGPVRVHVEGQGKIREGKSFGLDLLGKGVTQAMPILLLDPDDSSLWDVTFGCLQSLYSGIPLLSPSPSTISASTVPSSSQAPPMSSSRAGNRSNTLTGGSVDVIRREQVCDVFSTLITRASILLAREEEASEDSGDTQSIGQTAPVHPTLQIRLIKTLRDWVGHAKDQLGGDVIGQRVGIEGLRTLLERMGQGLTDGWDGVLDLISCILEEWEEGEGTIDEEGEIFMGEGGKEVEEGKDEEAPFTSPPSQAHLTSIQSPPSLKISPSGISTVSHASVVEGGSLMRETFACTQLICTDFLGSLTQPMLQECVRVVGRFGRQVEGLNVSLTAIQLLWMVSDHLRGMLMQTENEKTRDLAQPVWLLLLRELSRLGEDSRREVRHSACQSLFRLVEGMGADRLNCTTWKEGISEVLLPLAEFLCLPSPPTTTGKIQGERKKGMRMPQGPEWVETRQVVVSGMVRVMGSSGPEQIAYIDEEWSGLMGLLTQCIHGDPESSEKPSATRDGGGVEDAAIQGLITLIALCGEEKNLPEGSARMESIWKVWLDGVEGMLKESGGKRPRRGRFLTAIVSVIPSLCSATQASLSASRVQAIMSLLGQLVRVPSKEWVTDRERLGGVQESIVKAVQALLIKVEKSNDEEEKVYVEAVKGMMREMVRWMDYPTLPEAKAKDATCPMTWVAFGIWAMEWTGEVWAKYMTRSQMYTSESEEKSVYVELLQTLSGHIQRRYAGPTTGKDSPPYWKVASQMSSRVMEEAIGKNGQKMGGLIPCMSDWEMEERKRCWDVMLEVIRAHLWPNQVFPSSSAEDEPNKGEEESGETSLDRLTLQAQEAKEVEEVGRMLQCVALTASLVGDGEWLGVCIQMLLDASKLYDPMKRPHLPSKATEGTGGRGRPGLNRSVERVKPVKRPSLAFSCLNRLFEQCDVKAREGEDALLPRDPRSDGPEGESARVEMTKRAWPLLEQRCVHVLETFLVDAPLYHGFPLPRIRVMEAEFILQHMANMSLVKSGQEDESNERQRGVQGLLIRTYPLLRQMAELGQGNERVVAGSRQCLAQMDRLFQ